MSTYLPGKYVGEVTDAGFEVIDKEGDWKNTPLLRVVFKVVAQWSDSEDSYVELDEDSQFVRDLPLFFGEKGKATEKAASRSIGNLQRYFKWEGTKIENVDTDIVGSQFECVQKAGEDAKYDDFVLPGGGSGVEIKKNDKAGKSLGKRFNKLIKVPKTDSSKPATKTKAKPADEKKPETEAPADNGEEDDDVPF